MKDNRLALYLRVRDEIAADIESGKLKPNDSLPSERALSDRFDVSRMTARHALVQLEKEGLAYTNGRRNRFVAEPRIDYDLSKNISFFASNADQKTEIQVSVLSFKTFVANDEQCSCLRLPSGSEIHFHTRLCHLGGRPAFIEEEYVSAARFPNLWDHDIAQSMAQVFECEYGVRSVRDQIAIKQFRFTSEMCDILMLEEPAVGIALEQAVFDEDDNPISFGCQYWRGDVARFSANFRY